MVFKCAGGGASVPWHRDSNTSLVDETPIFNVGIYLDHSDPTNCLWAIPGSHLWSDQRAETEVQCKNKSNRFDRDGAFTPADESGRRHFTQCPHRSRLGRVEIQPAPCPLLRVSIDRDRAPQRPPQARLHPPEAGGTPCLPQYPQPYPVRIQRVRLRLQARRSSCDQ